MWQPPAHDQPDQSPTSSSAQAARRHSVRASGAARRRWASAALTTTAGKALGGILVTTVVVGFGLVYFSIAASHTPKTNDSAHLAPGGQSVLPTPTEIGATATPTAEIVTTATPTLSTPTTYLRVTQNQDYRYTCVNPPINYAVTLRNVGDRAASWRLVFPNVPNPYGPPYWAGVGTKGFADWQASGTVAVGQSVSLTIWPQFGHQCAGQTYQAPIHISVPNGRSQPDIQLTFAGSGPDPYAQLVVNQNQNHSEACVNGTPPPPSYTATLTDTGNERAFPQELAVETNGPYSTPSLLGQIHLTAGQTWIDAKQTVDITVTPQSWIGCNPGTYHIKIEFRDVDWQGDSQDVILTDTIT